MLRYLAGRLLRAILTIFLVITFAFFVLHLSGDPAMMILSADAPPESIKAFRAAWGLDRPLWAQYAAYVWNALHGDLGNSMRDGRPAIQLVLERVPATLAITVPAFLLKLVIGIPAGIYAALHRNSLADRLTMMVSVAGFTVPSFVLALVLVLVFSVQLGWVPSAGSDDAKSAILPIVTLGIAGAAILARFTRSAMLEVLGQDYIRTATAKGLRRSAVTYGHALRNALVPVVSIIGTLIPRLAGGAVVTEAVFGWPGMGRLAVEAANGRDYPLVVGITVAIATLVVLTSLVVDLAYTWIDPRIRLA